MRQTKIMAVSTFALVLLLSAPAKGMIGADVRQDNVNEILARATRDNVKALTDAAIANMNSLMAFGEALRNDPATMTLANLKSLDRLIEQVQDRIANLKGSPATKSIHSLSKRGFFTTAETVLREARAIRAMAWEALTPEMRRSYTFDDFICKLNVARGLNPEVNNERNSGIQLIDHLIKTFRILAADENIPTTTKELLRSKLIALQTRFAHN